ncbi:MAG: hypothetical protein U0Q03_15720 [Acidimicrobiales bacterium]
MWRRTSTADPAARAARLVTIVATVVFALIVTRCRPWELFVREGFSSDFYDEQARSLLRLHLWVRPEVPGPEGFLVDGRTYLYYGPFLAFARLPFAVFGDVFAGRLARVSMIVGYVVLLTGAFHLVRSLAPAASRLRVAAFVAAVACSPVLFLSGWVSVYHETELWAAAFATWAMVGALRLIDLPAPSRHDLLATGFALAAGITTRASVGIGVAAGVGLAVIVTNWSRIVSTHEKIRDQKAIAAVAGGSAIGFAIHAGINWAKFGSPTKLPGQLQLLSINDPARAAWFAGNHDSFFSLRFVSTTVVHYLRPDNVRFERLVPFVRYGPLARDRGSYPLETITASASLTASATLLLAAAIVGVVLIVRHKRTVLLTFVAGGAIAAVPTFTIGFIANRYLVDMLPMLLVPAAMAVGRLSLPSVAWRRIARIATVALVAWGAWCNVALAVWTQQLKEPGFTHWRYRVDGWVFGDPAPALVDLVPGMPVPRDGVVALAHDDLGACAGVYIAEQGAWVALERTNGASLLHGELTAPTAPTDPTDPTDSTTGVEVVGGDDWTIVAVPVDGGLRFELDRDGSDPITGDVVAVPADGVLRDLTVVVDAVMGQTSVQVGDTLALFAFTAPTGQMVPFAGFAVDADPGDSLCRQLEARR